MVVLFIMIGLNGVSQTKQDKLNDIRKKYSTIENRIKLNQATVTTLEYVCDDSEYGELTIYRMGDKIQKVVLSSILNEENSQVIQYYFWSGVLFFAYHVSEAPRYVDENQSEIHTTERRVYYSAEAPFHCLEKYFVNSTSGKVVNSVDVPNVELACTGIDYLKENLTAVQPYFETSDRFTGCFW